MFICRGGDGAAVWSWLSLKGQPGWDVSTFSAVSVSWVALVDLRTKTQHCVDHWYGLTHTSPTGNFNLFSACTVTQVMNLFQEHSGFSLLLTVHHREQINTASPFLFLPQLTGI